MKNLILKLCESCNTMKNMHPTWSICKNCQCGEMILTPTPEHGGGLWCGERKPCKIHTNPCKSEPKDFTRINKELLELIVRKAQLLADVLPEPHSESSAVVSRAWNLIGTIDVLKEELDKETPRS